MTKIWVSDLYLEDSETYLNTVMLSENDFTGTGFIVACSLHKYELSEVYMKV